MIKHHFGFLLFLLLLLCGGAIFPQGGQKIVITGERMTGRETETEKIRGFGGDVVITHLNVRITCDSAIHFVEKNEAELIGNVVITQDTLTIKTAHGYYNGNTKRAWSDLPVELDDKKVFLKAQKGEYLFNSTQARFVNNVRLYDATGTMTTSELIYFRNTQVAYAFNGVKLWDATSSLDADSLVHYRTTKITHAYRNVKIVDSANVVLCDSVIYDQTAKITDARGNVQIKNFEDNTIILGEHVNDLRAEKHSIVEGNPFIMQIDTSSGVTDTVLVKAVLLESFGKKDSSMFIAHDSVVIIRGGFASLNSYTEYTKEPEKIYTYRKENEKVPPVLWYDQSQLSGDTVTVFIKEKKADKVYINQNSLIISKNAPYRYDQVSGNDVVMEFEAGKLKQTNIYGNVLSFYYVYDEGVQDGLIRSSSNNAVITFDNNKVEDVKLYGDPISEYYPENLVLGNEKKFFLPTYRDYGAPPAKDEYFGSFLSKIRETEHPFRK
ncbi:MAG: LPS export ABC transporter periplasmic protein LptC [Ignavibacteriales bacterium]|nr:MAG: hypothetical protein F9K26_10295 [Ignavibacteriaceae bacterium]MBW7873655.1 LPS export ABC transporter periplasmic protein LptC [Ignavibacteria bacterium]MCZ2143885.1 LPS export ABC transporter periplasmic protein LptC [Ignavibacteriales bacterium]OQY72567.1 MAG: hypothetical protein B6D45_08990 [Ignavibacteriales bacterium UTCHB3]MBV6445844.1 LPS-assembly protein LptD [Ignavibacteriaceae bacterium]